jgi:hypothetical protein
VIDVFSFILPIYYARRIHASKVACTGLWFCIGA